MFKLNYFHKDFNKEFMGWFDDKPKDWQGFITMDKIYLVTNTTHWNLFRG